MKILAARYRRCVLVGTDAVLVQAVVRGIPEGFQMVAGGRSEAAERTTTGKPAGEIDSYYPPVNFIPFMRTLSECFRFSSCGLVASILCLITIVQAHAQPSLVSVVPADGAIGVSPASPVVFTFSDPMDTAATAAEFFDPTVGGFVSTTPAWSAANTVLTCTPNPAFGGGHGITWFLNGQDTLGDPLSEFGSFTTSNSSGTGSGTNKITTFSVGKVHSFDQTSTAAPILDGFSPYGFTATTALASNRTATNITLT